jgi:hypothetical protein
MLEGFILLLVIRTIEDELNNDRTFNHSFFLPFITH